MLTNTLGKIIVALALAVEVAIGIMSFLGAITNFWLCSIVVAVVAAIAYIIVTTKKEMLCVSIYAVLIGVILIGAGKFSASASSTVSGIHVMIHNYNAVVRIEEGSVGEDPAYIHLFDYDGYNYYTDSGYTFLYKIQRDGLSTEVYANKIAIEKDFASAFGNSSTEYYSFDNNENVVDRSDDKIAVAFVLDSSEECTFLKIVSPANKVFYTYFDIDDPVSFVKDLGIAGESISLGSHSVFVTAPTVIQDGTGNTDGEEEGKRYLISINGNKLFASSLAAARFNEDAAYSDRVNWFLYSEVEKLIAEYKKELSGMAVGTDEANALAEIIKEAEASVIPYQVELTNERFFGNRAVRVYVAGDVSGNYAGANVGVIELYIDGVYLYGYSEADFLEE